MPTGNAELKQVTEPCRSATITDLQLQQQAPRGQYIHVQKLTSMSSLGGVKAQGGLRSDEIVITISQTKEDSCSLTNIDCLRADWLQLHCH